MRVLYFLILVLFVGAIGLFAYQNSHTTNVTVWDRSWELPFPAVVGATYLLGMLSGWSVVGMLRRSWRRVIEERQHGPV
jgi:lipopolysaccharide assembly protein A